MVLTYIAYVEIQELRIPAHILFVLKDVYIAQHTIHAQCVKILTLSHQIQLAANVRLAISTQL